MLINYFKAINDLIFYTFVVNIYFVYLSNKGKIMSKLNYILIIFKLTPIVTLISIIFMSTVANTQTAPEPWTGAIPGDNIHFGTNDVLVSIRKNLNRGDITNAVRLAEKNIKSIENNSRSGKTTKYSYDAYNALCISLTAQKNYERALIACNTAIKDSPNRWFAFNSRGSLKYQTEKFKDAISDYRLALDNAPKFADITSILEHNIRLSEAKVTK